MGDDAEAPPVPAIILPSMPASAHKDTFRPKRLIAGILFGIYTLIQLSYAKIPEEFVQWVGQLMGFGMFLSLSAYVAASAFTSKKLVTFGSATLAIGGVAAFVVFTFARLSPSPDQLPRFREQMRAAQLAQCAASPQAAEFMSHEWDRFCLCVADRIENLSDETTLDLMRRLAKRSASGTPPEGDPLLVKLTSDVRNRCAHEILPPRSAESNR